MTSFAFIMGVLPLVMGVAVFSGMLGVTFFGLVLTPVFYVVVQGLAERRVPAEPPVAQLVKAEEGAHA